MPLRVVKKEAGTLRKVKKERRTFEDISNELSSTMKFVRQRFQFNIKQIEERYANKSSGLVFKLDGDDIKMDFDVDQCTARNEKDLMENIKRELHHYSVDKFGGAGNLSTPAEDPDQKDSGRISNWRKLNRLFDTFKTAQARQESQVAKNLRKIKREIKKETSYRPENYADQVFGTRIKREPESVAGSHVIDDPVIPMLAPVFYAQRPDPQLRRAGPMTRNQKRLLAIEESNEDQLYAPGTDWVDAWVCQTVRVKEEHID